MSKTVNSTIPQQLVDSRHQIDSVASTKTLLPTLRIVTKEMNKRFIIIAESVAIRLLKPELCRQRNVVRPLLLSWAAKWTWKSPIRTQCLPNNFLDSPYFTLAHEFLRSLNLTHAFFHTYPSDHEVSTSCQATKFVTFIHPLQATGITFTHTIWYYICNFLKRYIERTFIRVQGFFKHSETAAFRSQLVYCYYRYILYQLQPTC